MGGIKSVYLDIYSKQYYIKFEVKNDGTWILLKDNRDKFKDYKQCTLTETIQNEKDRLELQWESDTKRLTQFINDNKEIPYSISISGGKDSEVLYHLWYEVLDKLDFTPNYQFIFFNTTNECADVYKYIKARPEIRIVNPDISWWNWVRDKQNLSLPTIYKRSCCNKYKEGQIKELFNKQEPRVQIIGLRTNESAKRANYEFYMDYNWDVVKRGNSTQPKLWSKLCPLIDWTTTDIWLIMLIKGFYINRKYKLGWTRVGCNICPFSNPYEDRLIKEFYPKTFERFVQLATDNYNAYNIFKIENITLDEFINGAWKRPESKEVSFVERKPTPENVHALAEFKGISDEMALKYWEHTCSQCGKNVTPIANSMFFKIYGRLENEEDNRGRLCQDCICKALGITATEYFKKALEHKNEGCELF